MTEAEIRAAVEARRAAGQLAERLRLGNKLPHETVDALCEAFHAGRLYAGGGSPPQTTDEALSALLAPYRIEGHVPDIVPRNALETSPCLTATHRLRKLAGAALEALAWRATALEMGEPTSGGSRIHRTHTLRVVAMTEAEAMDVLRAAAGGADDPER